MSNGCHRFLITVMGTITLVQSVPTPAVMASSATQVNQVAKQITVLIEGPGSNGSGVILSRTGNRFRLLTSAHVVESIQPGEEVYALTNDQQSHQLDPSTIQTIPGVDLAVVEFTSSRSYPTARLGNGQRLTEGMAVYVAGFPLPTTAINRSIYTFVPGRITATTSEALRDGYGLIYNNNTLPGMSGGPVLNEKGEVIAIHGRADTSETQTTGYNNIYIKSGLNLGIPLNPNLLATIKPPTPQVTATPDPPPEPIREAPRTAATTLQRPPEPTREAPRTIPEPSHPSLISRATGIDYTDLRDLLQARQWEKADEKTYELMAMASNRNRSGAFTSDKVKNLACDDLQTIDRLWVQYSQGRFGFSVQEQIYQEIGEASKIDINAYRQFAQQVGWKRQGSEDKAGYYAYDDLNFSLNAPPGHLPRWGWGLNIAVVFNRISPMTERLAECKL